MTVRHRAMRGGIPAANAAILLELAESMGVARADALAGTAVDDHLLASPDAVVSLRDMQRLVDNCIDLSGDPAFALRYGARITPASLGALGYVLMSCDDVEQLISILLRYHRLMLDNIQLRVDEHDNTLAVTLDGPMTRSECEMFVAAATATLRKLAGVPLRLRISFAYPRPPYDHRYQELLEADFSFDALQTRLHLDSALLATPLQFANPTMRKLYQQQCDALLAAGSVASPVADAVRAYLLAEPGVFPGIEGAAEHLHMSARTLRRRLEEEGWTYQRLVHELRRRLAETYLQERVLSIAEIAQLLGYSDVSNFRRAFINWTGKSPAAYRRAAAAARR
jgi:AraC-like DNA-binding protein